MDSIKALIETRSYKKDELLLAQGQTSRHIYLVTKGLIRQFYYKNGRDISEHFTCEGSWAFCIESLFQNMPTSLCMEALEDSEVCMIDYAGLKELSDRHDDVRMLLFTLLEYALIVSQRKADSWRFESAHERYKRFCREYPEASKRASVGQIASYLLMAPETLSRVRAGLL